MGSQQGTVSVRCTSLDAELDKLQALLPAEQRNKLQLIFLVLDIEGHEIYAIDGIQKYSPKKVFMEVKTENPTDSEKFKAWAQQHSLTGEYCISKQDQCFNFHPLIKEQPHHLKALMYGARSKIPENTYRTSEASKAYMFYGQ